MHGAREAYYKHNTGTQAQEDGVPALCVNEEAVALKSERSLREFSTTHAPSTWVGGNKRTNDQTTDRSRRDDAKHATPKTMGLYVR